MEERPWNDTRLGPFPLLRGIVPLRHQHVGRIRASDQGKRPGRSLFQAQTHGVPELAPDEDPLAEDAEPAEATDASALGDKPRTNPDLASTATRFETRCSTSWLPLGDLR